VAQVKVTSRTTMAT